VSLLQKAINGAMQIRADATGTPGPADDFWYQGVGSSSATGMRVNAESVKRIGTALACGNIITRNVGAFPAKVYTTSEDGGKQVADKHPIYPLLYSKPNMYQTAFEFRQMMQGHFEFRGNAYAEKIPGPRGFASQLIPMHPDRVEVISDQRGRPAYRYNDPIGKQTRYLVQEEVFHLKGWSDDGFTGQSTISMGADVFGVAMAAQDYAARYFRNDATPPFIITGANFKTEESEKLFQEKWRAKQTGKNRHSAAILPQGLDVKTLGLSAQDAQLLDSRKFSRIEICSIFGVPPHLVGETEKAATYASVEQFNIMFAVQCLLPRLVMWEQVIQRDLLEDDSKYFSKFSMAALLRGDTAARFNAYKIAIENGWMCQDDVRILEDMNPIPNGEGKRFWRPLNWAPLAQIENPTPQTDPADPTTGAPADPNDSQALAGRIRLLAACAAEPCVKKEINEVRRLHERCEKQEFRAAVSDFYRKHANFLAEHMKLPLAVARDYCSRNSEWVSDAADAARIGGSVGINFDQLLNQGMQWLGQKAAEVTIQ
jgi:HK97 family phage portal protein